MTLREKLHDWTDWDGAQFALAVTLGIVEDGHESWIANKGIFWSANPEGDRLYQLLQDLVKMGFLEKHDEPDDQYRWKG